MTAPKWSLQSYRAWNDSVAAAHGTNPVAAKLAQLCRDARAELALARRCKDPALAVGALAAAVGLLLDAVEGAT